MDDRIRSVIEQYAKVNVDVATLDEHADLYQAGMTSHASVSLMLGLENELDVEFPIECSPAARSRASPRSGRGSVS